MNPAQGGVCCNVRKRYVSEHILPVNLEDDFKRQRKNKAKMKMKANDDTVVFCLWRVRIMILRTVSRISQEDHKPCSLYLVSPPSSCNLSREVASGQLWLLSLISTSRHESLLELSLQSIGQAASTDEQIQSPGICRQQFSLTISILLKI